mgnify:CR=1 FL=1
MPPWAVILGVVVVVTLLSAVVALAGLLSGKLDVAGKTVCVLVTGGNVDRAVFARALELA